MSLAFVVDTLAERISTGLTGVGAGDVRAGSAADLPTVVISIEDAAQQLVGIGEVPRGPRTGSLEVVDVIDLAVATLDFGDDVVDLVPAGRLTALLAHGPIVDPETADVTDDDGPYTLVDAAPAGRQVVVNQDAGQLEFGQPLPATGTLSVTYRIGMWDVSTVRFSGDVSLETTAAAPGDVAVLSRSVADLLAAPHPAFTRLAPLSWGPVTAAAAGTAPAHAQVLRYRFDFELEQVALPTGGGVIDTVAVTSATDSAIEKFDVAREGSGV